MQKVIVAGNKVHIYDYTKVITSFGQNNGKNTKNVIQRTEKQEKLYREYTRKQNLRRSKNNARYKIEANEKILFNFVTLTFRDNYVDITEANQEFSKFIKRLKYKYKNLKYFAVPERTKKGRIHYHMLVNAYINVNWLTKVWSHGYTFIKKTRKYKNIANYLLKYVTKMESEFKKGTKKYWFSRKLLKPLIQTGIFVFKYLFEQSLKLVYSIDIDNDFCEGTYYLFQKNYV